MRAFLALILLSSTASSTAFGDRTSVWSVGASLVDRKTGADSSTVSDGDAHLVTGARLTMAFEDPAMPMPAGDWHTSDTMLAPELLAGFLADHTRAEGYIGAGARVEMRFTSNRRGANQHTAFYGAGRAIIIGKNQDSATEFVIGGHVSRGADVRRVGWELGVMIRPHDVDKNYELDGLFTLYTAWR